MPKFFYAALLLLFASLSSIEVLYAQQGQGGDRFIRIAELGELVDSVNVWGDVNSSGRYLVPEGTNVTEIISYGLGYNTLRGREAELDWSAVHLEIKVSRLDENERAMEVAYFRYRYHDPEPVEMYDFILENNDIVTIQLRRKPSLRDYVQVISSTIGALATSILLIERLRGD
jgi:hypothetical protein